MRPHRAPVTQNGAQSHKVQIRNLAVLDCVRHLENPSPPYEL